MNPRGMFRLLIPPLVVACGVASVLEARDAVVSLCVLERIRQTREANLNEIAAVERVNQSVARHGVRGDCARAVLATLEGIGALSAADARWAGGEGLGWLLERDGRLSTQVSRDHQGPR